MIQRAAPCVLYDSYCRFKVSVLQLFVAGLAQINISVEPHSCTLNEGMIMQ